MADLNAIADGIEANLVASSINTSSEHPDTISPPHAVVSLPRRVEYHTTADGPGHAVTMTWPVYFYVSRATSKSAQRNLKAKLGVGITGSIIDAIESDTTLGGAADYCVVIEAIDLGAYEVGGNTYLGAELILEVVARE